MTRHGICAVGSICAFNEVLGVFDRFARKGERSEDRAAPKGPRVRPSSTGKAGLWRLRHWLVLAVLLALWLLQARYGAAVAAPADSPGIPMQNSVDDMASASAGWVADAANALTDALRPIFAALPELPAQLKEVAGRIGAGTGGSLLVWLFELLTVFAVSLVALRLAPVPLARWRRTQRQS